MLRNDGQRVKDIENDIPGTSGDLDPRTFRNDKGLGVCTSFDPISFRVFGSNRAIDGSTLLLQQLTLIYDANQWPLI